MFTVIINDCQDENARVRQMSRMASLIDTHISFVGTTTDIEAAGNLIEVLDATAGRPGIILLNVAPRGGHTRKWENGTPFGYVWYHKTLIVGTVDGLCFSGLKKFGLAEDIKLLDTHSSAEAMLAAGFITEAEAAHIPLTQFRSFDFTPRVAAFLFTGNDTPTESYPMSNVPDLPVAIWWIDNFGNCKTTLTENDVAGKAELTSRFGTFPLYKQLKDVPDGEAAFTIGSSGLDGQRFVEFVSQRQNNAAKFSITVGDALFDDEHFGLHAT